MKKLFENLGNNKFRLTESTYSVKVGSDTLQVNDESKQKCLDLLPDLFRIYDEFEKCISGVRDVNNLTPYEILEALKGPPLPQQK